MKKIFSYLFILHISSFTLAMDKFVPTILNPAGDGAALRQSNANDEDGKTNKQKCKDCPLHGPAGDGKDEALIYFLEKYKIPIDSLNEVGWTPLASAAVFKRLHTMKLLLERGANPELVLNHGTTRKIISRDGYEEVRELLNLDNFDELAYKQIAGRFIVRLAKEDDIDEIGIYVRQKCPVDLEDAEGKTALFYAAQNKNVNLIRALRLRGAKPEKVQQADHDLFEKMREPLTKKLGRPKKRKRLNLSKEKPKNLRESSIGEAIDRNDPVLMMEIIYTDKGDEKHKNFFVRPAFENLLFAIMLNPDQELWKFKIKDSSYTKERYIENLKQIIDSLLVFDDNFISHRDDRGQNIVHHAATSACPEILEHILQLPGCPDINSKDNLGQTPIYLATRLRKKDNIILLLKYGANEKVKGVKGSLYKLAHDMQIDEAFPKITRRRRNFKLIKWFGGAFIGSMILYKLINDRKRKKEFC